LPKGIDGEFVWKMEDVLELYAEPYDPQRPLICFDEASKELHAEVTAPLPAQPHHPARVDYEYRRAGTANLFLIVEPLAGYRHVMVTQQRTKGDFAQQMKYLCEVLYPEAQTIRVVLDNLNTHNPGSLYAAFAPEEARRLTKRLEFHYTPKHASWLNMAELEFSVLHRQCLDRRIATREELREEVTAWQAERNQARVLITWCFRVADARVKMAPLYRSELMR
jgi:transposase